MRFTSCKDCENRFPGCHSQCEKYKAERAEYDKRKAKYDRERGIDYGLYQQRTDAVNKALKDKKRGGKYAN